MSKPKRVTGEYTLKELQEAQKRLLTREVERMRDEDYNRAMAEYEYDRGGR